ncbi:MAG: hypothetical protein A2Y29_13950 [Spirochaetes bacterium GWE2_31_10]|nr:MAG: hypothetical protein A2Y29_13950 [Spirochaetes bacterium GWE2_31_10]
MDKATNDILEKVKKLMALGNSPSEAEAASALEKARVLLARYGLSLADVKTQSSEIVQNVILEKKRLRAWESHLIHVICNCTFTQAIHAQRNGIGQVLIIGRELNTLAAADLFTYLHLAVLKLSRSHSDQVGHLDSFRHGLVHRIGERLTDASAGKEETGGPWAGQSSNESGKSTENTDTAPSDRQLTIQMAKTAYKENQDYIEETFGKTTTKKVGRSVDSDSYHKGRTVGDNVSLNRQIFK